MGKISDIIQLEHLAKKDFINLCEYILDTIGLKHLYFAQTEPVSHEQIEIHPDYFFDIPLSGEKHITFGTGEEFQESVLLPGDVLFCRPFTWKYCQWDYPHEMACFIFKENFVRITYVDIPSPMSPDIYPKSTCFYHTQLAPTEAMTNLLLALNSLSELASSGKAAIDILNGLLNLTLELLKDDHTKPVSQSEITFHRIQQYLHDNYHAYINRKYVSHVFDLHPGYISRLYKEYSTKSFFETLYSLRMEHAAILLKNTDRSVAQIAEGCGYESLQSFTSAFKKFCGVPPGRFRLIHHEKTLQLSP